MSNNKPPTSKDLILQRIRERGIGMRPKLLFSATLAATAAVAVAVLAVSVFLFNFIVFSLRINNHDALLSFGYDGVLAFLLHFPWTLLAIDIALILLLEWLLRRFRFGYKIPVLYLLLGIALLTVFAGVVIDKGTPLNDRMIERARHLPPPMSGMYDGARKPWKKGSGLCHCEILSIAASEIIASDIRKGTSSIRIVLPLHDGRATTTSLAVGDVVLVAGKERDGVIYAFGIRKLEPEHIIPAEPE